MCCSNALFFLDNTEVVGDDATQITLVSDPSYAEQELADAHISIVTLDKYVNLKIYKECPQKILFCPTKSLSTFFLGTIGPIFCL